VLVSGESGIGKTRLVAEVLTEWDGGRLVSTAFPWQDAFAPFAGLLPDGVSPEAPTVLDAIRGLASDGPTVLVLEDLQVADTATIELLPSLATALEACPVLVLGVYRSDALPRLHAIRRVRHELRRGHRLVDIAVGSLTRDETGELVAGLLGVTPAVLLVDEIHARTEGLPFFVEELTSALLLGDGLAVDAATGTVDLARSAGLPLPEGVVDAVVTRTADLCAEHGGAVEQAATLGVSVDLPTLTALVGPGEVDALLEDGVLQESDSETAMFRHALVRDALYRSIPWARRRDLHREAAAALAAREAPPALVADHWLAAQSPERARPLLLAAAEQHCAVHAYRDAAVLARRAIGLWPEGEDPAALLDTLERLAECAELCGEPEEAADTWADIAARHRRTGDLERAAVAHRRSANACELLGDLDRTTIERDAAARAFGEAGAPGDAAAERLALAQKLRTAGQLAESLEQAVLATEGAVGSGRRDLEAHALAFQGAVRSALGDGAHGVELARAGLELALSERLTESAGETYYALAEALEYATDYSAAVEAYHSAFEMCQASGRSEFASVCFVCMSPAVRLMGDWERTRTICTEVLSDRTSSLLVRRIAEEESGLIDALQGNARRARGPLRRAAEFARANRIFGLQVGADWGLAVVAVLAGQQATARSLVRSLLSDCGDAEECHYALPALRWAATYLAEENDAEDLALCHRVVATLATRNGSPKVLSALAHVGAELALLEEDAPQARMLFDRALDLLTGITAPYEHAHTQWRLAVATDAVGDRGAAVEALTGAYRTARNLAAKPLARQCASTLVDLGEPVDRRLGRLAARDLQPGGLTRREQEVLGHLATGMTNREIASALFLSTRTVDMHVRNLLVKLDCTSRTAAVQRATRSGLVPSGR